MHSRKGCDKLSAGKRYNQFTRADTYVIIVIDTYIILYLLITIQPNDQRIGKKVPSSIRL